MLLLLLHRQQILMQLITQYLKQDICFVLFTSVLRRRRRFFLVRQPFFSFLDLNKKNEINENVIEKYHRMVKHFS